MLKMTRLAVMALVTSHTDACDQCLRSEGCETGRRLMTWAIQKLSEMTAPIPEPEPEVTRVDLPSARIHKEHKD